MISVLTPSIRPEGLDIVKKALDRQTFDDYEWLIGSPFEPKYGTWVKDDFTGGVWTLNRIYNKLIKQAKGELIVSWQDYTFADPDCLEMFWNLYVDNPEVLVSAVGNKYERVYPERKNMLWKDPRERNDMGLYYPCFFNDIEWNLCMCPKKALYSVGGFDEEMDFLGFGMDGYSVNDRLETLKGYDFKLNQSIKSYSLVHGRVDGWDDKNMNMEPYELHRAELIKKGSWPVLGFLKEDDGRRTTES